MLDNWSLASDKPVFKSWFIHFLVSELDQVFGLFQVEYEYKCFSHGVAGIFKCGNAGKVLGNKVSSL